ncbi:MAG: twin-arginine translocase TatA/TatE family subunit [Actinomycetota bacterium]|nr:twin-arginine translocase TatA/TatE family subunit [Actinomycetota bacterium]
MGVPGPTELIILLVIILLLFGAKRIPELAKGLGTGMREFRKGSSGEYELEEEKKEERASSENDKGAEEDKDTRKDDASIEADREEQRQS